MQSVGADDVLETVGQWLGAGHRVVLGTVVKTWGSSPRPAGSSIAVRDDGTFVGSVSGGCAEGIVIEAAAETLRDRRVRMLEFGVSDERAWSVGLACGGQIQVLLEAVD